MTQPQQQTAQDPRQVLATAALALALLAIEAKARQDVEDSIAALYKGLAATALLAAASAPGTVLTGLALISLPRFHDGLTQLIATAQANTRTIVDTAYQAAAATAAAHVDDLPDYTPPAKLPNLGTTDTILRDIDTMFGHAQTDFQNQIAAGYDPTAPDRADTLDDITGRAQARLTQRATAAATTAVQRAATDTQQSIYTDYQLETGTPGLMKRWRTASADPCGMCRALNGTQVGINAEFDHTATTADKDLRPVWRNLSGPPRHPNCRCKLELVTTPTGAT